MHPAVHIVLTPEYEFRVQFRYDKVLSKRIKEMFEFVAYRRLEKCWDIPPTPRNLRALPGFVREVNARMMFTLPLDLRLWRKFSSLAF